MSRTFSVREKYIGTGALDAYGFDFKITALDQILVVVYDDTDEEIHRLRGDDTTFLDSVDFDSVDGGGTVNLLAVLPADYTLVILFADDAPAQESEFRGKSDFTLKRIENALDKAVGGVQRAAYLAQRAIRINDVEELEDFDGQLPPNPGDFDGCIIALNLTGTGLRFGPTVEEIEIWKNEAQAAAIAAAASENAAAGSEAAAAASEAAAAVSAAAAAGSAVAANASAVSAAASAATATNAAVAAGDSEVAAALSETNAAASEAAAAVSETNAAVSEAAAAASAQDAADVAAGVASVAAEVAAVNAGVLAAQAAQAAAEAAQAAAETAETNAETAQAAAQTAETNAETAQGLAETAQLAAEAAQGAAEAAEVNAETAQGLAEAAALAAAAFDPAPFNSHIANTSNPHSVTKTQVGLSNVSNDAQLKIASNLSDLNSASTARTNLGLGTMATQAASAVAITGGTLAGDFDGGTASNTQRITVPKNTKANLDALTRKEGTIVYATDQAKAYVDTGAALIAVGSGGGGGGTALKWYESGAKAPYLTIASNLEVAQFSNGETQEYFAAYRVPASYEAGTQITVKIMSYSTNSSGTILMKTLSTLIRTATDVISSTTNQHASTTASYTASGTTQNKVVETTLDITDAAGLINSVAVSAGDTILIKLYRDTDTATDVVNLFPYSSEVISA